METFQKETYKCNAYHYKKINDYSLVGKKIGIFIQEFSFCGCFLKYVLLLNAAENLKKIAIILSSASSLIKAEKK